MIFFICPSGTLLIIFYYVLNLWGLRRPDFIPLALLASDFFYLSWPGVDKEIGESVDKEISGLILSSDSFLAGKWPSFSTEAQRSGQRPLLLAAAMYKIFRDCNIHSLPLPCWLISVCESMFLPVSKSFAFPFKLSLALIQLPNP